MLFQIRTPGTNAVPTGAAHRIELMLGTPSLPLPPPPPTTGFEVSQNYSWWRQEIIQLFLGCSWKGASVSYLCCRLRSSNRNISSELACLRLLNLQSCTDSWGKSFKSRFFIFAFDSYFSVPENAIGKKQTKSISDIRAVAFSYLQLAGEWMTASKQTTVCPAKAWLGNSCGNILLLRGKMFIV